MSHTRFHCRQRLLIILHDGIIIHSPQRYGTETMPEETMLDIESQKQALSACILVLCLLCVQHTCTKHEVFFFGSNGCFVLITLYIMTTIFRVIAMSAFCDFIRAESALNFRPRNDFPERAADHDISTSICRTYLLPTLFCDTSPFLTFHRFAV